MSGKTRHFISRLQNLCTRLDYTLYDLAKILNESALTVEKWKAGQHMPDNTLLSKIACVLALSDEERDYLHEGWVNDAICSHSLTVTNQSCPESFSSALKAVRRKRGVTLVQAGDLTGIGFRTLGRWEQGQLPANEEILLRFISDLGGVSHLDSQRLVRAFRCDVLKSKNAFDGS